MIPRTTMREALSDPALFGRALADASWDVWKVLLIAAFGEPLIDDHERATYHRLTGREAEPGKCVDVFTLVVGRKGGKSRCMSVVAAYVAALVEHETLVAGERGVVLCVAQSREVARIVLDFTAGLFEASPLLRPLIANRTQESLTLSTGITIEVRTASFRSLRGPSYVCAICDEIAFWYSDAESANPDAEIVAAIEPALGLTRGMLILASSPYARRGVLWDKFKRYYGLDHPGILVARGTTRDLNPTYPQARIDAAIAENPAKNRAEYLAEFRRDIEGYVSLEALEACVTPGCYERGPERHQNYVGFCDPSGGGGADSMSLAVGHVDFAKDTIVLDAIRERMPPFSPEEVVEGFAKALKTYRCYSVYGDRFAGEWPREVFAKHGITYISDVPSKSELYGAALSLLNSARAELLDHERMLSQFSGLECTTTRGGAKPRIDHGPGGHDDVSNAAAGVIALGLAFGTYDGSYRGFRDDLDATPDPGVLRAQRAQRVFDAHCERISRPAVPWDTPGGSGIPAGQPGSGVV